MSVWKCWENPKASKSSPDCWSPVESDGGSSEPSSIQTFTVVGCANGLILSNISCLTAGIWGFHETSHIVAYASIGSSLQQQTHTLLMIQSGPNMQRRVPRLHTHTHNNTNNNTCLHISSFNMCFSVTSLTSKTSPLSHRSWRMFNYIIEDIWIAHRQKFCPSW